MPITRAITTAPARGSSSARMPNNRDAAPVSASSHSWEMYWRRRIAATISRAPVTKAQAATRYTSVRAVIPGENGRYRRGGDTDVAFQNERAPAPVCARGLACAHDADHAVEERVYPK